MKLFIKPVIACLFIVLATASWARPLNNQDMGMITGGIVGGLLGSTLGTGNGQLLAVAAGTLAGAYIGNSIGKDMDETDKMRMIGALERNAIGQPAYWHNARTGVRYRVVPVRNVYVDHYHYCREYRSIIFVNGHRHDMYGTACRQPDGYWEIRS